MSSPTEPSRLAWFANRLRCMSAAEVGFRLQQALTAWRAKYSVLRAAAARPSPPARQRLILPATPKLDAQAYVREANAMLDGVVPLFAYLQARVGAVPDWHRDPRPLCEGEHFFAAETDLRRGDGGDGGDSSDIRYVWEINRHLHWVRLAQAYALTGDARYARGLAAQLHAWLEQCPPGTGPNWSSALEMAVRLANWSVAWQLLGGWDGALFADAGGIALRERWLASIHAQQQYIRHHLSRHSSANNHLVGELTGLYLAARTWPFWRESPSWASAAKAELEREAVLQHAGDGGNREQAFAYQAFTCECLMVAGIYGARGGDAFSSEYWQIIERALRFLRSMRDAGGHFPLVGDADDGALLRLAAERRETRPATILALGEAVFGAGAAATSSDTARWLLGDIPALAPAHGKETATSWRFPDSGYYLFGSRFGERDEIKGMVDCGPLGYLGIAAHGHADALAIWLSIAGEPCLVDAGTFSYGDAYRWRDYFRGTAAHNTLRIDGQDQSVGGGRFLWRRKAHVSVTQAPASPERFEFVATHDGYLRLRDPARHVRNVTYDASAMRLVVKDNVISKATHQIEQFWHFAPEVVVRADGHRVVATGRRFALRIQCLGADLHLETVRGQSDPPLAWYSRGYGLMEPLTVLRVHTKAQAASIETRFEITLTH